MNDPVPVVWQMHRNSEFTLIFFGKVTFIFGNTENPTSYAPEHRKIPIDRPGMFSASFLFLSVLICEAVVLLCLVQSRCSVCVSVCWKCFLLNRVYIFSASAKYVSCKKCHQMFGKKFVMLTMPCERTVYRIEF